MESKKAQARFASLEEYKKALKTGKINFITYGLLLERMVKWVFDTYFKDEALDNLDKRDIRYQVEINVRTFLQKVIKRLDWKILRIYFPLGSYEGQVSERGGINSAIEVKHIKDVREFLKIYYTTQLSWPQSIEKFLENHGVKWVVDNDWTITVKIDPGLEKILISRNVPAEKRKLIGTSDQPVVIEGLGNKKQFDAAVVVTELISQMIKAANKGVGK